MKRFKNDDIAKRAELSKRLTKTTETSMHQLVSSKQKLLSNQSNRRMSEDANTMAALASVIIRSQGEYDDTHKKMIEQIELASEKISLPLSDRQNLVSIINPFICTLQEESVPAQRLIAKNDQYKLVKLTAKLSLKDLLEACRQIVALGQSIATLQPTFDAVANLLLNLGQVIYYISTRMVHLMDPNETILLKIIIERTFCGRRSFDLDTIIKDFAAIKAASSNPEESDWKGIVNTLMLTFENEYRIIDVSDGKVSFVEEISFT